MNHDERVRRFIDGELSADEKNALLDEAAGDLALSTALLQAQVLREELRMMQASVEPTRGEQVQRIMQRAVHARSAQETSPWRWLRALWRPRVRVSVGGLLMSLLAVALGAWLVASVRSPSVVAAPDVSAPPVASAERVDAVDATVRVPVPVRFVLPAQGARSVSVVGDFNGWQANTHLLDDADGDGVFVTTVPLPPGSYDYMFVVDGERWLTDPLATNVRDDGFGQRNAVLRVN